MIYCQRFWIYGQAMVVEEVVMEEKLIASFGEGYLVQGFYQGGPTLLFMFF